LGGDGDLLGDAGRLEDDGEVADFGDHDGRIGGGRGETRFAGQNSISSRRQIIDAEFAAAVSGGGAIKSRG
jgi:hypothetical protein